MSGTAPCFLLPFPRLSQPWLSMTGLVTPAADYQWYLLLRVQVGHGSVVSCMPPSSYSLQVAWLWLPLVGAGRAPLLIKPGWRRAGLVCHFPSPPPLSRFLSPNHLVTAATFSTALRRPATQPQRSSIYASETWPCRALSGVPTYIGSLSPSVRDLQAHCNFGWQRVTFQRTTPLRPALVPTYLGPYLPTYR